MVPKEHASIKYGLDLEPAIIVVKDINFIDETEDRPNKKGGHFTINFPYAITFADKDGKVIQEQRTVKTMYVDDLKSKFYANAKGFTQFTKDHDLLALVTVLKQAEHKAVATLEVGESFDINSLIGTKFKAIVKTFEDNSFIDWVNTFKFWNIEVPKFDAVEAPEIGDDEDEDEVAAPAAPSEKVKKQIALVESVFDEDEDEDDDLEDSDEDEESEEVAEPKKKIKRTK